MKVKIVNNGGRIWGIFVDSEDSNWDEETGAQSLYGILQKLGIETEVEEHENTDYDPNWRADILKACGRDINKQVRNS